MPRVGIMQGRLLPPQGERIQSFPAERWTEEFALAAEVPLDAIEWIYEVQGAAKNPVATPAGIDQLQELTLRTGVMVRSLCADYFMDRPLIRGTVAELAEAEEVLVWLLGQCRRRGIERVVLPFVDKSRIADANEQELVAQLLHRFYRVLDKTRVELHLETDLPPLRFAELLAECDHPQISVNYDTGNSAFLGYLPRDEFFAYGHRVRSVHIKDRVKGGGTVPLGTGDTDFASVFAELKRIGYSGDFILQVARDAPGDEVAWARKNRYFLEPHLATLAS